MQMTNNIHSLIRLSLFPILSSHTISVFTFIYYLLTLTIIGGICISPDIFYLEWKPLCCVLCVRISIFNCLISTSYYLPLIDKAHSNQVKKWHIFNSFDKKQICIRMKKKSDLSMKECEFQTKNRTKQKYLKIFRELKKKNCLKCCCWNKEKKKNRIMWVFWCLSSMWQQMHLKKKENGKKIIFIANVDFKCSVMCVRIHFILKIKINMCIFIYARA